MKLYCYFQAISAVSAGAAFGSRGERCQNVIDFFRKDKVIRNDSKLMKKMVAKSSSFIDTLKAAEQSCEGAEGRIIIDDDDYENDGDRTVNNSNVYDKIESCFERFDSYIDQKISAKNCPNSHARAKRVLTRMNGRMRKAAEARTKRMLSAGLRKQNVEDLTKGLSKEDQALKQAAKAEKRDNKDANAAVVAAKQAEKALKQSGKQADRELRAEKDQIKSDNQAEKAVKQADKAYKQQGKQDKRDRKSQKPIKESTEKPTKAPKDKKDKKNKNADASEEVTLAPTTAGEETTDYSSFYYV